MGGFCCDRPTPLLVLEQALDDEDATPTLARLAQRDAPSIPPAGDVEPERIDEPPRDR